jgi:hypothetical protein
MNVKKRIIFLLFAGIIAAISYSSYVHRYNSVPEFVENNLIKIISSQEEKLEIKHFEIPKIKYGYKKKGSNGYYDEVTETIFLRDGIVTSQGCTMIDKIANFLTLSLFSFDVQVTLDHELGHYYPDKLSKSIGNRPWPIFAGDFNPPPGLLRVSEGIAEYFAITMNPTADYKKYHKESVWYPEGYDLVKPIIDKYGRKGIEYLILNSPKPSEEPIKIKKYQKKILNGLQSVN